jgi:ribosome-binding factor A
MSAEPVGYRLARLEQLLAREIAAMLRDELSDPLFEHVRVTHLLLSVDYRHARVHYALTHGAAPRDQVERALARVIPWIRGRLAEAVELRRVPDLRFVLDAEAAES